MHTGTLSVGLCIPTQSVGTKKAEIILEEGKVIDAQIKSVKGKKPLTANTLKDFKLFLYE